MKLLFGPWRGMWWDWNKGNQKHKANVQNNVMFKLQGKGKSVSIGAITGLGAEAWAGALAGTWEGARVRDQAKDKGPRQGRASTGDEKWTRKIKLLKSRQNLRARNRPSTPSPSLLKSFRLSFAWYLHSFFSVSICPLSLTVPLIPLFVLGTTSHLIIFPSQVSLSLHRFRVYFFFFPSPSLVCSPSHPHSPFTSILVPHPTPHTPHCPPSSDPPSPLPPPSEHSPDKDSGPRERRPPLLHRPH